MRVCFFNRSYWPDTAATGQLLTELAEDLVSRHGCQVSVVCGVPLHGGASSTTPGRGLAARGESLAAFDERCIPAGCVAPRSNTSGILGRRALPAGRLARLGATPDFHHGLLGIVRREQRNGVSIFRAAGTTLPPRRFAGRACNYLTYFGSACAAGLMVPAPDVVVALTDPPMIGLAGVMTAVRARAKFVFLCEDVFPEVASLLEDFHNAAVNRTLDRVSKYLIRRADRVVAIGERMRERLIADKKADPAKVRIIHQWADCSAVRPMKRDNAFARAERLVDKFVVMHSGNVGLSQDLETLIAAADRLREYPGIVIAIVGHGARLPALQAAARERRLDNVRFLPQQPKERLGELFASADVFLVSLKRGIEGYIVPSKLPGILAAGRACIVAADRSAEPVSIVEANDCGLTAEPGDPYSLAAQILTLYRDRPRLARMGANAREAAYQFDRPRQVDAYYRVFAEVTGSPC